jgi:hypothetical protein
MSEKCVNGCAESVDELRMTCSLSAERCQSLAGWKEVPTEL